MPVEPPSCTPTLRTPRLVLRAPAPTDAEGRQRCGHVAEVQRMLGAPGPHGDRPMTVAEARAWADALCADPNPLHWAIEHRGELVGTCRLHQLECHDERARFGIALFDRARLGQGLGAEATRAVLAYAFDTLGLHRVDLRVLAFNARAIATYRRCGFVVEGRERDAALVDGERHDDLMMAVLATEQRG